MKKFCKLFILALCSWFLFLWFNNAQNLGEKDFYTDEYDNLDPEYNKSYEYDKSYEPSGDGCHYTCAINLLGLFSKLIQAWIWIILWILLVALTVNAVILHKKFKDTQKDTRLSYIPILNLYSISKITIWRSRFFCLILLIWFFVYSICRNFNENRCCIHNPSQYVYLWIILWISAIIILWEFLSWLSKLNKKDSDGESSDKIE